ncbi:hypothetical protein CSUB01_06861 [Colletotrichum sublineola]|uniref:Uncharacterized protein n=1 Tax=Colletotrichum sublineola TaxID=1173701 RepID=A0A066X4E9_COLSU|nr:hypothetical protein CSUB01_06861 [Colletotrichum sublineola]
MDGQEVAKVAAALWLQLKRSSTDKACRMQDAGGHVWRGFLAVHKPIDVEPPIGQLLDKAAGPQGAGGRILMWVVKPGKDWPLAAGGNMRGKLCSKGDANHLAWTINPPAPPEYLMTGEH